MSDNFGMPMVDVRTDIEIKADLRNQIKQLTEERDALKSAIEDFLDVIDSYPDQLVPINRKSGTINSIRLALKGASDVPG